MDESPEEKISRLEAEVDRLNRIIARYRPIYSARRITAANSGYGNPSVSID